MLSKLQAALSSHPDKVAEDEREEADARFKAISQAYEILYDEEKRDMYDTHGMAAFDSGRGGMAGGTNVDDILQQMFGMGGGMPPGFGGGAGPGRAKRPRKGADEDQPYPVTLEELYKGKSARFSSTKTVVCSLCKGKGGKENAKPKACDSCHGQGNILLPPRYFVEVNKMFRYKTGLEVYRARSRDTAAGRLRHM